MRYIGDIHGKFSEYTEVIKDCPASIQVGDFGFGFGPVPTFPTEHRFIRGNHDSPDEVALSPNWIPDGHTEEIEGKRHMFIGGAWSIDWAYRTEGRTWWRDEELSIDRLTLLTEKYLTYKPEVMITHDCPQNMVPVFFNGALPVKTRTQQALQSMFDQHKPDLWIFGHWHVTMQFHNPMFGRTKFICLPELGYVDI